MSADKLKKVLNAITTNTSQLYWITLSRKLEPNYSIGIKNSVWGIKQGNESKLQGIKKGDFLLFYGKENGFTVCEILSKPYEDHSSIWPDDIYPHRVRISEPLVDNKTCALADVYSCLTDRFGKPYQTPISCSSGISGPGGIFRKLTDDEIDCILSKLGWHANSEHVREISPMAALEKERKMLPIQQNIPASGTPYRAQALCCTADSSLFRKRFFTNSLRTFFSATDKLLTIFRKLINDKAENA